MQDVTDGFVGDVRQIRGSQRLAQQGERPGGGLVLLALRRALDLGQDTCLLRARVARFATTTLRNREGCQAVGIEALHQLAHAARLFEACHSCRVRKGLSCHHRKQRLGSSRHVYSFTARFDNPTQFPLLLLAQGTQRNW
jgi:hypothetical protein